MRRISTTDCVEATAAFFGKPVKKLTGNSRQRRYARPRQIAMFIARQDTNASLPQIAKRLHRMDHTTVHHGISNIERLLASDLETWVSVTAIRSKLYDPTYQEQRKASESICKACRSLCKRKSKAVPTISPVFIERLSLPRTRAPRPVHVLEPSMIPAPSKSRLMGARA